MANTVPTKLSITKYIYLIFLFIFNPKKFLEKEDMDNKYQNSLPQLPDIKRLYKLRKAFRNSFILITCSGLIGFGIGSLFNNLFSNLNSAFITILQISGALILLWATLALRGWDIQSCGGITFTERVNQWIYRFLYCLGTSMFIISMTLK